MNTFSPNSPQLENKQYEFYTIVGQHDFLDKEENPRVNNDGNRRHRSIPSPTLL